jgi:hypothetical protein
MGLRVRRLEPLDGHVRVDLRRRERGVAEQFLDHAKVGTTFEQVGRGAVTQPVRAEVGSVRDVPEQLVHHRPDLALVGPTSTAPEEQGGSAPGADQAGPTAIQPFAHSCPSGHSEGHTALLVALADDPQDVAGEVDVIDVEPDELTDADAGGVEKFQCGAVAEVHRVVVVGGHLCDVEQGSRRSLGQNGRQRAMPAGSSEPERRVGGDPPGPLEPAEEGPQRGGGAGDRGPGGAPAGQHPEPGPQVGEGDVAQPLVVDDPGVTKEHVDVSQVGPHGVYGAAALGAQVALERWQRVQRGDGHSLTVSPHPSHLQHGARAFIARGAPRAFIARDDRPGTSASQRVPASLTVDRDQIATTSRPCLPNMVPLLRIEPKSEDHMPTSHCHRGRARMATTRVQASLLIATGLLMAATACTATGSQDDARSATGVSATPPQSVAEPAPPVATTEGTFDFSDGTTVGVLAQPWTNTDRLDGQLLHMLPGAPGTDFSDAIWGDIIIYVPDVAYSPGAVAPEPMPADPVAWTASHPDLEILDQREITVDGVTATQIDARATTTTNWLAVEAKPFEWGGAERVVLIPRDDSWLVVRGSAFQEDAAFDESRAKDDAFAAVLDSVDLAD